ncbi:putative surface protease GP63 [Trypanosoma conorhini]|uniref:Leishmanolysin-like peptidase n=1 Tax=Trypanosoma conorhini TaxID=83891 RepID=A0A422P5X8_9TRYP|nr:putative surface protease GP63 [Trypanosoma conorhini]RNF13110.1 putative surface protease GP63 [Trypanosoma conorhini]
MRGAAAAAAAGSARRQGRGAQRQKSRGQAAQAGRMGAGRPLRASDVFRVAACALLFLTAVATAHAADPSAMPRHYVCVHDQVALPHDALPYANVKYRDAMRNVNALPVFTAAARQNIRFHAVFLLGEACSKAGQVVTTYLGDTTKCTDDDVLTPRKVRTIRRLVKRACAFLEQAVLVDPLEEISVDASVCPFLSNPAVQIAEKDYVVFVTANPRREVRSVAAWARWCMKASTGRPVVGHVNFIPGVLREYVTEVEARIAMHEVTHALGFSNLANTAGSHVGPGGKIVPGSARVYRPKLGKNVTLVTSPRVVAVARRHFNCPTLDGVEIEDGGGPGTAGSHWKKRILYEEVLVGSITTANLFYSSLTLAFLEDLGYYSINYSVAEDNYRWGRNRSCRFLYNKCNDQAEDVDEFCFHEESATESRCTHDRLGAGRCDVTEYPVDLPTNYQYFSNPRLGGSLPEMDYCPSISVYFNVNCVNENNEGSVNLYGDEMGQNSRCFKSNLITSALPNLGNGARCLPMMCTSSGQILLRVQGQTVPCPANGTAGEADTSYLRGVHGKILCPSASLICGNTKADMSSAVLTYPNSMIQEPAVADTNQPPLQITQANMTSCVERVKCAENIDLFFPACRLSAKRIRDCFGRECQLAMRIWLDHNPRLQQCKDPRLMADSCLDGWMGAHKLCAMDSAASSTTNWLAITFLFTTLTTTTLF